MVAGVLYWALALLLIAGLVVVACFVVLLTWLGRRREARQGSVITVTARTLNARRSEATLAADASCDRTPE